MLPCRGDCSVSHLCLQVVIWSSSSGRGSGLFWLRALCLFFCLSPPATSVFTWPCLPVPISPGLAWGGTHPLSVDHSPLIMLQVPCL